MLNWSVEDVENFETVCYEKRVEDGEEGTYLKALTNTIIMATMAVGIPSLTEKTVVDFFARISMNERLFGAYLLVREDDVTKDRPITIDDLRQHIGLKTNASRFTWTQFVKNQAERHLRETEERVNR